MTSARSSSPAASWRPSRSSDGPRTSSTATDADGESFSKDFAKKVVAGGIQPGDVAFLEEPDGINLAKTAITYSDAVIFADARVDGRVQEFCGSLGLPVLPYSEASYEDGSYIDGYDRFYDQL